jgi:DHA1 family tetracycline resistance protein-like MFS transporter
VGTLPAFVAAALSALNLLLAFRNLPESLPAAARGKRVRRAVPLDLGAFRESVHTPGIGAAVFINFMFILWFAGMEQTFRLFTADRFDMSDAATGRVFGLVGLVSAVIQGGLVGRLARRFGEGRLVQGGLGIQAAAFALLGLSPLFGGAGKLALYLAAALIAAGNGLTQPSLPAFASRRASADNQGMTLGTLQSASALARALGPLVGGVLYATVAPAAPYFAGAIGLLAAGVIALARLR